MAIHSLSVLSPRQFLGAAAAATAAAYLNEQGEPVSIPNQEGEISTPSVVMYDKGEEIVGTFPHHARQREAQRIVDGRKSCARGGKSVGEVFSHPDLLRALAGTHDGDTCQPVTT